MSLADFAGGNRHYMMSYKLESETAICDLQINTLVSWGHQFMELSEPVSPPEWDRSQGTCHSAQWLLVQFLFSSFLF